MVRWAGSSSWPNGDPDTPASQRGGSAFPGIIRLGIVIRIYWKLLLHTMASFSWIIESEKAAITAIVNVRIIVAILTMKL